MNMNSNKRNIGKNLICCKGYFNLVTGPLSGLFLLLLMTLLYVSLFAIWAIFVSTLFNSIYFYIIFIIFIISSINYLRCFFIDPGIIPRNHPSYQPDEEVRSGIDLKIVGENIMNNKKDTNITNEYQNIESNYLEVKDSDRDTNRDSNRDSDIDYNYKSSPNPIKKRIINMFSTSLDDPILFDVNFTLNSNSDHKRKNVNTDPLKLNNSEIFISNDNSKNQADSENIPSIFTKRICKTCNILRPAKTSHCSVCDNCVKNFDHHCYFVGNCIGERNEKCFLLFLFFGTLVTSLISLQSIIHIAYISFFEENKIIIDMFSQNPIVTALSILLFVASVFLLSNRITFYYLSIPPGVCGIGIFLYLFYTGVGRKFLPIYVNPFSIIVLCGSLPLGIFVGVFFYKQLKLVTQGLTTKQFESIKREMVDNVNKGKIISKIMVNKEISLRDKIRNLIKFLLHSHANSLITDSDY